MGYRSQKNKPQWTRKFKHQLSECVKDIKELSHIIETIEAVDGKRRYGKSYIIKRTKDRNTKGLALFTEGKLYEDRMNGGVGNKETVSIDMKFLLESSPSISLHGVFMKLKKSI